ncbi:orotate phosphoribosyltransferase [Armatimonas rosea]|uniref:Orotate phosphoribosyltransferase n=1 Tax=Armatimonas rosea TaxID=685828 RepID=A0A7W9W6H6_ARMRO|nr:orotate phosphoribosyltransferase [Armatimonas rosea]MBB6050598.1 orotate phosphoribosyltransferase [Armatimonas rosea]
MTDHDVLEIFTESGALLKGHFVLTSGRHSDTYFEKFHVLRYPPHVETLCKVLAARCAATKPDVVLGPTTLGILLAYEVAKQLGVPAAYGEKGEGGKRMLRRPEHLVAGQRVLVVDDVLTTGGSIRECMELVESVGATLCGVGVVVDRSAGKLDFGAPLAATLSMDVVSYPEGEVPDWLAAIPITRPGSTGKK